jgi:hypothetical protein
MFVAISKCGGVQCSTFIFDIDIAVMAFSIVGIERK